MSKSKCASFDIAVDTGTDRVDANGRLGGNVGRLDRLYRLIDPLTTGSIPQKIDRLDRFPTTKKQLTTFFAFDHVLQLSIVILVNIGHCLKSAIFT